MGRRSATGAAWGTAERPPPPAPGRRWRGARRWPARAPAAPAPGTAVVVTTGGGTELGRISSMLGEATETETPLTRQIAVFGRWLTVAIVVVAVLLFPLGLLRG